MVRALSSYGMVGFLNSYILQAKKQHPFLKRYRGDWPIKVYLRQHFNNKRSYARRTQRDKDEVAAKAKDKGKGVLRGSIEDIWYFGSSDDNENNNSEQEEF